MGLLLPITGEPRNSDRYYASVINRKSPILSFGKEFKLDWGILNVVR
jgi:hypothetical protein